MRIAPLRNRVYSRQTFASIALWAFIISYILGNILLHGKGNKLADLLADAVSLPSYLLIVRISGLIGVILVLFIRVRKIWKNPKGWKRLVLFISMAIAMDLSLIVVPIERIHYVQYGFLTWICYKAMGKEFFSALIAFFCGAVDEAYQYWVLYADSLDVYFDWNDITLNFIGVLAVLFFFLSGKEKTKKFPLKWALISIFLWVISVTLFILIFDPDQYLVRNDPYEAAGKPLFWITSNINTHYHIMYSFEGLTLLGIALILTSRYYFSGESYLFPDSQFLSNYNLTSGCEREEQKYVRKQKY